MSWSLCYWMELGWSTLFLWGEFKVVVYYKLFYTIYLFIICLKRAWKTGLFEQDGVWALGLPGWCTGLEELAASFPGSR